MGLCVPATMDDELELELELELLVHEVTANLDPSTLTRVNIETHKYFSV